MSPPSEVRAVGDSAVMVELARDADPQAILAAARARWPDELQEAVAGDCTVLLQWRHGRPAADVVEGFVASVLEGDAPSLVAPVIRIAVRYDGEDLQVVADRLGLDVEALIATHTASELTVRFVGTGGFPYLVGGSPSLDLPRRPQPRVRVPAGAVAIAAGYTGIYPTAAPGGWWLLGSTDQRLFDASRRPPSLIEAGTRVVLDAIT